MTVTIVMAENGYSTGLSSLICTADVLVEVLAGTQYQTVLAHFMHCSRVGLCPSPLMQMTA